ncbi:MAG: oligosaccharide flippase family protein [Flavobacteriales bacterium]|nr:oligosaccharide flippase family protein [Flavobacteriales bacterium]
MSENRKILSDSIFLTVGNYLMKLKGLIFMPVIISSVGLANYGIFVQIFVNLSMISPFCTLALGESFKRFTSKYAADDTTALSNDFWTVIIPSFLMALIGATILFFTSPIICEFLFKSITDDVLWATRISSVMIVERVLWEQLNKYLLARKKFKQNTVLTLLYAFVPYLGLVAGFVFYESLTYAVSFFLMLEAMFMVFLFFRVAKGLSFQIPRLATLKKFLNYSWALIFTQFESGILAKVDRYFISYFLGPAAVGIYNVIYSVVSFLDDLSLPFRRYYASYLPVIWDSGETDKALNQVRLGIRYYFVISWLGLVALTMALEPLLTLVLNKESPNLEHFEWIVFITGVGIIAEGGIRLFYQVINMQKRNAYQVIFQFLAVLVNVGLNFVLVPKWGLFGAGFATFVSYVFILLITAKYFSIGADVRYFFQLGLVMIISVLGAGFASHFPAKNMWLVVIEVGLFSLAYLGIALGMKMVNIAELKALTGRTPKPSRISKQ